jgi:tetratricopeptide (TPR) repeat protein
VRPLGLLAALALALAPQALGASPEELVAEGCQFLAGGDTDGAISHFGEAQSLRPNSPEVDLDLGLAHYRKGEHDRAAEYFTSAAAKDGGRLASVAEYNLGNARVKQGRPDDALEAYRAALEVDPENDDARFNYELLERHLTEMREQEKRRKEAEEEVKRRFEELVKEARQLFEQQAEAVARTWVTAAGSEGPLPTEKDIETLKGLAEEEKPLPDKLAFRIARALVKSRGSPAQASSHEELARIERDLAVRARKAATEAATLAAAIRPPPRPKTPPQPGGAQDEKEPLEHPLVDKLERAGGALEEGGKAADAAAVDLERASFPSAEPNEVAGFWRFSGALGELTVPEQALQRKEKLRAQQVTFIRDLWESFPDSRGELPGHEEGKAFWERVKAGETLSEEDRMPMARQEVAARGAKGSEGDAAELESREAKLAEEALALGWEMEAIAASSGGRSPVAALAGMLRPASEAMEETAAALRASPPEAGNAERSAVLALVRLSRAPTKLDAILAELDALLLDQVGRVLDTWKSDTGARGELPTEEELEKVQDEIERAREEEEGEAGLTPDIEAKLGRYASAVRAGQGLKGEARAGEEAGKLQADLAQRASTLAGDMKGLASSGRPGEMNPAGPMLEAAAKDVESAKQRMDAAATSLPSGFRPAEPEQARAVAALERALSKLAQGAAGSAGREEQEGEQEEQQKKGEQEEREQDEGERREGEEGEQDEKGEDGEEEEEERESVSKQQAGRLLDEAAQEEREVRRDIRKRLGTGAVEVRRDW